MNRRRMAALACVAAGLAGLFACGHAIPSNDELCEAWLESSACGTFDFSTVVDCAQFADEHYNKCDLAGYFDCLDAHTTCDAALGIATVDTAACAAEALCSE